MARSIDTLDAANSSPVFRIGVFALIFDDQGRILLGHRRDTDWWNLPGGGMELGETVDEAVRREVREETGLEAMQWRQILDMHLSNSVTDERAVVYLATDLKQGAPSPEDTEVLTIRKVSLKEALEMIEAAEITDAISVAAILKVAVLYRI